MATKTKGCELYVDARRRRPLPNPLRRDLDPPVERSARVLSVFCDGSAHDRPHRPGGWAFVVVEGDNLLVEGKGAAPRTSSTQMELEAARAGLRAVALQGWHRDRAIELVSDSRTVLEVAGGGELPTVDRALAEALREMALETGARLRWVRAHDGVRWNEHVDRLAAEAKQSLVPGRVRQKQERRRARRLGDKLRQP